MRRVDLVGHGDLQFEIRRHKGRLDGGEIGADDLGVRELGCEVAVCVSVRFASESVGFRPAFAYMAHIPATVSFYVSDKNWASLTCARSNVERILCESICQSADIGGVSWNRIP